MPTAFRSHTCSTPRPTRARVWRAAAALAFLAGLAPASTARAQRHPIPDPWWTRDHALIGSLVSVEVRTAGRSAPLYRSPGQWDRHYFEAERGRNYALRIRNRTGRRVGVLIAVDGLNVVNGERSGLSRYEPMYVLDPWGSATIRGWRTSLEHVRQFVFVDQELSYASRTGQTNGDLGWIRVLAFEEERPVAWLRDDNEGWGRDSDARERAGGDESKPAPQAPRTESEAQSSPEAGKTAPQTLERSRPEPESFPGTGWGDRRRDPVREVWFEPAPAASDHLLLRYEYAAGLHALGIFPDGDRLARRERGAHGFAQPPRW